MMLIAADEFKTYIFLVAISIVSLGALGYLFSGTPVPMLIRNIDFQALVSSLDCKKAASTVGKVTYGPTFNPTARNAVIK